jgi:hypothetical protein
MRYKPIAPYRWTPVLLSRWAFAYCTGSQTYVDFFSNGLTADLGRCSIVAPFVKWSQDGTTLYWSNDKDEVLATQFQDQRIIETQRLFSPGLAPCNGFARQVVEASGEIYVLFFERQNNLLRIWRSAGIGKNAKSLPLSHRLGLASSLAVIDGKPQLVEPNWPRIGVASVTNLKSGRCAELDLTKDRLSWMAASECGTYLNFSVRACKVNAAFLVVSAVQNRIVYSGPGSSGAIAPDGFTGPEKGTQLISH